MQCNACTLDQKNVLNERKKFYLRIKGFEDKEFKSDGQVQVKSDKEDAKRMTTKKPGKIEQLKEGYSGIWLGVCNVLVKCMGS